MIKLIKGDALKNLAKIPDKSVDAIICDIPFGTTACKWDVIIPFGAMWNELEHIIKPNGAIVLFGSQPFTSLLIKSNINNFKYELIWYKNTGTGIATAKYQPMKYHENILVFSEGRHNYYPIPTERFSEASKKVCKKPVRGGGSKTSSHIPMNIVSVQYDSETKNPESVLCFKSVPNGGGKKLHPTQKPIELMEYLVKTYTKENDTILDFAMGSGTTGVACVNLTRNFIGIEKDDKYFEIAEKRINGTTANPNGFEKTEVRGQKIFNYGLFSDNLD